MGRLNHSPSAFLGYAELKRLMEFLDTKGWRQHFIKNSSKFGLIKNDENFTNGLVQAGTNIGTLKVNELFAIDKNGDLIYKETEDNIAFPAINTWYWLKVRYEETVLEEGLVSIDATGNLTGVDTKFTEILRGQPNFPSKIKFDNSSLNTDEYNVLQVIDDNSAILQGDFTAETSIKYSIIGTFSPGSVPSSDEKNVFRYDGCNAFTLADDGFVLETITNTPPTITNTDEEFYIARVRTNGTTVEIEDKRNDIYKDLAIGLLTVLSKDSIPNIGVEAIKYSDINSTRVNNIMYLSWSFRSSNFTINTATNIITLNAGEGGKYKSVSDFTNGDFDGYRIYADNGSFSLIKESTKTGSQINLVLDKLDNDDFVSSTKVLITPNCESIEIELIAKSNLKDLDVDTIAWQSGNTIRYTFNSSPDLTTILVGDKVTFTNSTNASNNGSFIVTDVNNTSKYIEITNTSRSDATDDESSDSPSVCNPTLYEIPNQKFEYMINEDYAKIPIEAFRPPYVYYQVYYKMKLFSEYTGSIILPSDSIGYYSEDKFDSNGDLIAGSTRTTTSSSSDIGFIKVVMNEDSYINIINRIDIGDVKGVETRQVTSTPNIDVQVGVNKEVQYIYGTHTLTSDHVINLKTNSAVNGNRFRIIIKANIDTDSNLFEVRQDWINSGSTGTLLKSITETEISYMLLNQRQIVLDFNFNGTDWIMSVVETDSHRLYDIKMFGSNVDLTTDVNFNSTGLGVSDEYLGWAICNGSNGTDDLSEKFVVGYSGSGDYDTIGNTGGVDSTTLLEANLPSHTHTISNDGAHDHNVDKLSVQTSWWIGQTSGSLQAPGNSAGAGEILANISTDPTTDTEADHNHGGVTGAGSGTATAVENRPPYYVLGFIQRIP